MVALWILNDSQDIAKRRDLTFRQKLGLAVFIGAAGFAFAVVLFLMLARAS